jgi:hypothetical protein
LLEIPNRQNAQAGELLKTREIPVPGNQGYAVVEAALSDQSIRNFRPDLAAKHSGSELSCTLPVSQLNFELLYPKDKFLQGRREQGVAQQFCNGDRSKD